MVQVVYFVTFFCLLFSFPYKDTKVSGHEYDQVSEVLGISALITNDFRHSRGQNYPFNWNKIMRQDGETGIALQYCHARLHR